MGTIKKIANADYSEIAVGKYDFDKNVFRRKVAGGLERNYVRHTGGFINGYNIVDLSDDFYQVKASVKFRNLTSATRIFSVADYALHRSFAVGLIKELESSTSIIFQFWIMVESTLKSYNISIPITEAELDYDIYFTIDYANHSLMQVKINNTTYVIPGASLINNADAWTTGETRTVCFGQLANYTNSGTAPYLDTYFAQLLDANNNILLHYDFIGDNLQEILMDKSKMITMKISGNVTVLNSPIVI